MNLRSTRAGAERVSLQWFIDEQSDPVTLRFLWEETEGPSVVSPTRADRTSIEEMARGLGKSRIDYRSGRLKYEVEVPLDEVRFHKQKGGS
jgi:hypothetical protein